jgi:hypothetical protein
MLLDRKGMLLRDTTIRDSGNILDRDVTAA